MPWFGISFMTSGQKWSRSYSYNHEVHTGHFQFYVTEVLWFMYYNIFHNMMHYWRFLLEMHRQSGNNRYRPIIG